MSDIKLYIFFFFQAEDGIRDYKVTGVQTCALPIYRDGYLMVRSLFDTEETDLLLSIARSDQQIAQQAHERLDLSQGRSKLWISGSRSEERRVGKECRSRWSPYH